MITTVTIWICRCGAVSHLEGSYSPTGYTTQFCPATQGGGRHSPKPVLVVVPYA